MTKDVLARAQRSDLVHIPEGTLPVHALLQGLEGSNAKSIVDVAFNGKVSSSQAYLTSPRPEDALAHLFDVPKMCILVQEAPFFQDVDLVEPLLEYLPLFEEVKLGEDPQLKVSVLLDLEHISFPSCHDEPLTDLLKVLNGGRLNAKVALSLSHEPLEGSEDLMAAKDEACTVTALLYVPGLAPARHCPCLDLP